MQNENDQRIRDFDMAEAAAPKGCSNGLIFF